MDTAGLVQLLAGREADAILRTLAMMAYNPAIGRVLEKGGVGRFSHLMAETVPQLYGNATRERFDALHAQTCERIMADFKTAGGKPLSYGQAQKPLNVFLKVYVDWAGKPTRDLAERLTPHLHVPLDLILMKFLSREFCAEYDRQVATLRRHKVESLFARLKSVTPSPTREMARRLAGGEFSLAGMDRTSYLAWQNLCRTLWPGKPVQLDVIWFLNRRPAKRSAAICAP